MTDQIQAPATTVIEERAEKAIGPGPTDRALEGVDSGEIRVDEAMHPA